MKKNQDTIAYSVFSSGRWRIGVATSPAGLIRVMFPLPSVQSFLKDLTRRFPGAGIEMNNRRLAPAVKQLKAYLNRRATCFDLDTDLGVTPFQRRVLEETAGIPYGETRSYVEIARSIGHPKASRAVGAALHINPLPIVIPCHRVIGSDGSLVGFSGGLRLKAALLKLEGTTLP